MIENKIKRKIFFKNSPVTLIGRGLEINNYAPFFNVINKNLNIVGLNDFNNKIKVITSFPSLNTSICSNQVKILNSELYKLNNDMLCLGISKDLPFAQNKFCEENNISKMILLSDYRYSSFGINYGLLIKELNLLARSALILDKNNVVRYIQIADEISNELDYNDILINLEKIQNEPDILTDKNNNLYNIHDNIKLKPLSESMIFEKIQTISNWKLENGNKIIKYYQFTDSLSAKYFTEMVNTIAEEQNHHPEITLNYNKVKIILSTHVSNGLTQNDFILAKIIDELE